MAFMILFLNYHNIIVEQPHYFLFFGQQETLDQKNKDNIKICVSFLSREKSGLFLSGELNLITWPYDSPGHSTKRDNYSQSLRKGQSWKSFFGLGLQSQ
jgi:hypothetical protein